MKNTIQRITLEDKIKLDLSEDIIHKIKYLCNKISNLEWSGILLYKVDGTFKTPKKLTLIVKDIIPMHVGTPASTGYEFNTEDKEEGANEDKMIDYFNANPHALEEDWKFGLIHSHNTMKTYFSSVDMEELEDNIKNHDFYLSLIVNNNTDLCAKVAFLGECEEIESGKYKTKNEHGTTFIFSKYRNVKNLEKMFIYDCDIIVPEDFKILDQAFLNGVEDIIEKQTSQIQPTFWNFSNYHNFNDNNFESTYPENDEIIPETFKEEEEERFVSEEELETFASYLIQKVGVIKDLEPRTAFRQYSFLCPSPKIFSDTIFKFYQEVFNEVFPNLEGHLKSFTKTFISHLVEYYLDSVPSVRALIYRLNNLLTDNNGNTI